jgi:adenylosuccinate lyase
MIPRYAPADLAGLLGDVARFDAMLEVELLALEAMERHGIVPAGTAAACRAAAPTVDEVSP